MRKSQGQILELYLIQKVYQLFKEVTARKINVISLSLKKKIPFQTLPSQYCSCNFVLRVSIKTNMHLWEHTLVRN